ncbi:MAG: MerR family transcriptional regulator [Planctomycetes bacterium]|nr:MerR family transcriptional regulator [Planctomycetota bacterium]
MGCELELDTATVARRTGISARRLGHWDRLGIVSPSVSPSRGSGSRKLYSGHDLAYLLLVSALRQHGGSLELAQTVVGRARSAERELGDMDGMLLIAAPDKVLYCGVDERAMMGVIRAAPSAMLFSFDVLMRDALRLSARPSQPEIHVVDLHGLALQVTLVPTADAYDAGCNAYPEVNVSGKSAEAAIEALVTAIKSRQTAAGKSAKSRNEIDANTGSGAATWGGDW